MPRTQTLLAIAVVVMLAGSVAVGPGVVPGDTHNSRYMKEFETRDYENTDP